MRWHNHMYAHRLLITAHHGKLAGSNHNVPESMPPTSSINQGHEPRAKRRLLAEPVYYLGDLKTTQGQWATRE